MSLTNVMHEWSQANSVDHENMTLICGGLEIIKLHSSSCQDVHIALCIVTVVLHIRTNMATQQIIA